MKKTAILSLLLLSLAFAACDKDDAYKVREWTIASQLGIAHGASTLQPVLLYKAAGDLQWRPLYGGIEGFTFEPGYEYRLRVRAEQIADPPADAPSVRYTLLEELSKDPARSVIPAYPEFNMQVAAEPVAYNGFTYLNVRFPDTGINEWQPWPYPIEGFDYRPGYTYLLHIATSIAPIPVDGEEYYTVRYTLIDSTADELPRE